jgi:hypothetical protein
VEQVINLSNPLSSPQCKHKRPSNPHPPLALILYGLVHILALTPRRTLFELLCESRMNLNELYVPSPQSVQRTSTEASDKDADVRWISTSSNPYF